MYKRLAQALEQKGVSQQQVAALLSLHRNTVSAKLNGIDDRDFEIHEALLIRNAWFPEYDFIQLFERAPRQIQPVN